MAAISEIEGIGPAAAAKLKEAGITTTSQLLEKGASAAGRKAIAEASGIPASTLLEWVNHADLERIKGVGWEYADLLEAAGVDTVAELGTRNAENLHAALTKVNSDKKLVRRLPTADQVTAWVAEAKTLPKLVSH